MKIRTTLATLLSTTALVTVLGGGAAHAAAAPAAPTPDRAATPASQLASAGYANLSIRYAGSGYYTVTVSGRVNITTSMTNNVSVKLYGDDGVFDDYIADSFWHSTTSTGYFWVQFSVSSALLNEDWGQDEVYAVVNAWYAPHMSVKVTSNTVTGYF